MQKKFLDKIENKLRILKHIYLKPENEVVWLKGFDKKFDVSIDAGANRGYISKLLSMKSKNVISIEPLDYLATYLVNVLPKNCIVLNKGASSEEGASKIKIPIDAKGNDISALSSMENSNNFIDSEEVSSHRELSIDIITIDNYVEKKLSSRNIDFIKIDVEGHEEALLEGAKRTILTHSPIVLIEMEERHGSSLNKIYDFFSSNNYSSYFVKRGQLQTCNLEFFRGSQDKYKIGDVNYISDLIFIKNN